MQLSVHRIDADLAMPEYHSSGAIGFDLTARLTTVVPAKGMALVPNNLVVRVPAGYGLFIFSRSSTLKKKGLMVGNGVGVIDQDYCGPEDELMTCFYNPSEKDITIERGERWSQAVLLPAVQPELIEDHKADDHAVRGGFGSTGTS
ncbi:dUTP diphosphatase [Candidatus Gracilibacteria bacterium CG17_big_fil_post_rev_8_21_14_2_50_48_13]|nr:MAG: dUTP diphosphatase [Candidatus Gracilibacteria bacterium CG17_big_fil_post_rev_8_21_14_2_50_48_13]